MHLAPEHGTWRELATLAPLGVLDAADRRGLADHLRGGCAECRATMEASSRTVAELAAALTPVQPSPAHRARVLASCHATPSLPKERGKQRPRRARGRRLAPWRLAAALAVAMPSVFVGAEIQHARHEAERERLLSLVETVAAASARAVVLGPGSGSPRAHARGFLDPESRRIVLFVHGLPPPPRSHSYQLWALAGERPSSAGTFLTSGAGAARHAALAAVALDPATRLAVTLEPAGGSEAPTGPIVLAER